MVLVTSSCPNKSLYPILHEEKLKRWPCPKSVVFLAVIFLAWSPIGHAQSPRRVEIIAKRFTYEPDTITLKKGEPVVLVVHSIAVTHGIKIEAFNIKSDDIKRTRRPRFVSSRSKPVILKAGARAFVAKAMEL
jgi:hypothetical protein